ncbi:MAG: hypothetical protein NC111_04455 [Bacteroides sp.]|nr:hypothetical protein [Bacteroides sp.]MCM1413056.1 hypothetical protein [Bacteroides sp.]MCM1471762.1 hypothetical protein [Bacteroides sp.]
MNEDDATPASVETDGTTEKKKRPLWRRILKWGLGTVAGLLLLLALAVTVALWYLTPERLTGLVNKYGSDYLNADVHAGRVELTFWSTFPRFNISVDNLTIVSHSLDRLPKAEKAALPADADSLLAVGHFSGGLHLLKLIEGKIDLYDLDLRDPKVNIFIVNDSINNFDIVPPSEETDTTETPLPEISVNHFALSGQMPVQLRMPADSIDCTLTLTRTNLKGTEAPAYTIGISGNTSAKMAGLAIPPVPFTLDGCIDWDQRKPSQIGLRDFRFTLLDIATQVTILLNFDDGLIVDSLHMAVEDFEPVRLLKFMPDSLLPDLSGLHTDLTMQTTARLTKPYRVGIDSLPSVDATLLARASQVKFEDLNLHYFDLDVRAHIDGDNLDQSTIDLRRLAANGHAMEMELKGTVVNPMSDPLVDGTFTGTLFIDRLPAKLLSQLPWKLEGTIKGNARARLRMSQLTPKLFHKVRLDGELQLDRFRAVARDGSMDAYVHHADMHLGSNSRISVGDKLVDSLLTTSLNIDTCALNAPGLELSGRRLAMNVGMRNTASSSDTTAINPVGGTISAGSLTLIADSGTTAMKLVDASIRATLRRFESKARAPQLDMQLEARRIGMRTADMGGVLIDGKADLTLHPRARRPMSARMQARIDSLAAIYPDLSTDSLTALARKQMRRRSNDTADDGRENIDFAIDNSLSSWLRLWQLSGNFTASVAGVYTPYYPTRNRFSDLNVEFSTDSVIVHEANLRSGLSDFHLEGSIRNIRRALTSKRHVPIELDFVLKSDTIDINDIMATVIRGSEYTGGGSSVDMQSLAESSVNAPAAATGADTDGPMGAFIVPSNVSANFRVEANRIHYGDLWLKDFNGTASMYDGTMALENLHALTDMGEVNMTALYSAPTARDISFAGGLNLRNLNLHEVLRQMPQIDSLMPMLHELEGMVDAQLAISTELDSLMNIRFSTLDMALRLSGKDLVLLDSETFRTVAKWLLFKNKQRNVIDKMDVEITVHEGWLDLYPVIFDMDRYRLGVVGSNDLNFNLDYHVAVLKSPIPFKFGINIKGTPEKMKIRLGKAKINEKSVGTSHHLTDSLRVNLLREIGKSFRRGLRSAGAKGLKVQSDHRNPSQSSAADDTEQFTPADSAILIREGLMEAPAGYISPEEREAAAAAASDKKKKKKK